MHFLTPDGQAMCVPNVAPLEIVLRGTLVYLSLFLMLRFVLKREAGQVAITDLLVVVLLADAAQNAMGDSYVSIPDGVLLMAVIVMWAYLFDRLSYYHPWLDRLLKSPPLPLIVDGEMIRRNMRKEFITDEELMMQLRLQGIDDLARVKKAFIESDGRVSIIEQPPSRHSPPDRESS
jgi:uncharacterized membrane protein YcaP (DUF421 family)